jgi:hypothetical protein
LYRQKIVLKKKEKKKSKSIYTQINGRFGSSRVSVTPVPFTTITEIFKKEKEKRSFPNSEAQSESGANSWISILNLFSDLSIFG